MTSAGSHAAEQLVLCWDTESIHRQLKRHQNWPLFIRVLCPRVPIPVSLHPVFTVGQLARDWLGLHWRQTITGRRPSFPTTITHHWSEPEYEEEKCKIQYFSTNTPSFPTTSITHQWTHHPVARRWKLTQIFVCKNTQLYHQHSTPLGGHCSEDEYTNTMKDANTNISL